MTMPDQHDPASVFAQRPSFRSAVKDTAATLPRGSSLGTAYAAGKQLGAERYGGGAQPAWGNGDGGEEANGNGGDDHDAMHADISSELDSLQGGMAGIQNRMEAFGQGNGSQAAPQASGTGRPPPELTDYHAQTMATQQYMTGVHEQVSGAQASLRQRAANWAARTPQGLSPSLSGNAMSATQGSNTMNGLVGAGNGNGMSESTYQNKKWGAQSRRCQTSLWAAC